MKTLPFLDLLLFLVLLVPAHAQNKESIDTLAEMVGSYRNSIDPDLRFNIKRDKDKLILEVPGQGQTDMVPLGGGRFRPKQVNPPAIVEFVRDSTGKVRRFLWIQNHKGSVGEWLQGLLCRGTR